jgi:small-conductance mechanosensitive channel
MFWGVGWWLTLSEIVPVGLLLLTVFLYRVRHPWWGVLQTAVERSSARRPARLRYLWYVSGVGFPVALMVLTALGYTYSAERLISRSQHMVLLVGLILGGTLVTTRALPGLLEVAVIGRLPIDTGARHATVIISRYTVTLVGVIAACSMLGMKWSSVQWLSVDKEFRRAGLEIAFPQQDVHIRDINLQGLSALLSTASEQPKQDQAKAA